MVQELGRVELGCIVGRERAGRALSPLPRRKFFEWYALTMATAA